MAASHTCTDGAQQSFLIYAICSGVTWGLEQSNTLFAWFQFGISKTGVNLCRCSFLFTGP